MWYWLSRFILCVYTYYLLWKHSEKSQKWKVEFKRVTSYCGVTDHEKKTIIYSTLFAKNTSWKEIKYLVCHEVAHVLTSDEIETHGNAWKKINRLLGGRDEIYTPMHITTSDYKYIAKCPNGDYEKHYHIRYTMYCPHCGHYLDYHAV